MQLYFQAFAEDLATQIEARPPVVIIPGLFGSTANWRSFARRLSVDHPVYVIDQRNHGRSPHDASHSYADMVSDLIEFCDHHNLSKIIPCGHSMGGKTAMMFGLLHPDRVARMAVLDIAPINYQHSHAPFLDELIKIDLSQLSSRNEADRALRSAIPNTSTRLFLLQSLTGSEGAYKWRLNLEVLRRFMPQIVGFPEREVSGLSMSQETVFILGEDSNYVTAEHHQLIANWFPNVQYVGIPEAAHWLHVDQPQRVLRALKKFLKI